MQGRFWLNKGSGMSIPFNGIFVVSQKNFQFEHAAIFFKYLEEAHLRFGPPNALGEQLYCVSWLKIRSEGNIQNMQ